MAERLLIIGSGMAAARLLEELAVRGCQDRITVVGAEPQPSYDRIRLSAVLSGEQRAVDLRLLEPGWYERHRVRSIVGDPALRVDLAERTVHTRRGRRIGFDRLVFATGARAHVPSIAGVAAHGVFAFRTLADVAVIGEHARRARRAVVIGGGLLGLEAAHGLGSLGVAVTVVHRHAWLMNRQLDAAAGVLLRRLLERRGMRFLLGASPVAVEVTQGRATGIQLDCGEQLPADLVVFAAGIDPETAVAAAAGIPCRRGIVVDRRLASDVPGVFALGECCEVDGRTFGLVAPIWQQAAVLADVLTGRSHAGYRHVDAPTLLKVSGIDVYSAGSPTAPSDGEDQVLFDDAAGVYRRLVLKDGRLVAAILVGDRSGSSWYGDLIASGDEVAGIRRQLMFGRSPSQSVECGSDQGFA